MTRPSKRPPHARARRLSRAALTAAIAGGSLIVASSAPRDDGRRAANAAAVSHTVTVYKSPTCGCCTKWIAHMRAAGFQVVAIDRPDVNPVKGANGVTTDLASCHTAIVRGYAIEGHVPAADVLRLLSERPAGVRGLAAPGMPNGSPGMEGMGRDRYDVVAFDSTGGRRTFASH